MKLNTRDRGKYNGFTKRAVLSLIQKSQKAQEKKRHFAPSEDEKAALKEYYKERLANAGLSVTRAAPDYQASGQTARVEMGCVVKTPEGDVVLIRCGSVECLKENVTAYRYAHRGDEW